MSDERDRLVNALGESLGTTDDEIVAQLRAEKWTRVAQALQGVSDDPATPAGKLKRAMETLLPRGH